MNPVALRSVPRAGGTVQPRAVFDFIGGGLDARLTFSRASAATRRDSSGDVQAATSDEARFDHDASGNALGLLMEFSRTNSFLNSATPATHTSPSLSNGTYTLWMDGTGSVAVAANTATISGGGTATAASPVTFTVSSPGTVDFTVTGTPTRAQCENGAQRTSFIVTAGAAVTRAADVCTLTLSGIDGFDRTNLSMLFVFRPIRVTASAGGFFVFQNGTNNDDDVPLLMGGSNGQIDLRVYSGGGAVAQFAPGGVLTADTRASLAFGYRTDSMRAYIDSAAAGAVDTSITVPAGMSILRLGDATGYWGGQTGCWIERVELYNRRLPDELLERLSA